MRPSGQTEPTAVHDSATFRIDPPTKSRRRMFVVRHQNSTEWIVTAEACGEAHVFESKSLAFAYAGLWASANAPSRLLERMTDGELQTIREFD
jgi:hypothetical protein